MAARPSSVGEIADREGGDVLHALTREAGERAMRVHEAILRDLSGERTWLPVADILGGSPRSLRCLRWRFAHEGCDGLDDGRRVKPSPERAGVAIVTRILRLYRTAGRITFS